jgi:ATP-dependent Clp protease adaptor protein ClpS
LHNSKIVVLANEILIESRKYCFPFHLLQKFGLFLRSITMITYSDTKLKEEGDTITAIQHSYTLIVWNDEVNSFVWVIETLILVCGHSKEQAEQCAMIIDSKGKYSVKEGEYDVLKPMCDAITDRGIGATIEVMAD